MTPQHVAFIAIIMAICGILIWWAVDRPSFCVPNETPVACAKRLSPAN